MQRHLVQADAALAEPRQQLVREMQAGRRRRDRAFARARTWSGSRRGRARRARGGRRYRAAAASRRVRRWPGRAPARERKTKASPPLLHLFVEPWRRAGRGNRPCPRRRSEAIADLELLGRLHKGPPARAVEPLVQRRLDRGLGVPRPMRRPFRLRRDHLGVVDDQAVARPQQVRQVADGAVVELGACPGRTTSSRAASRGLAGRKRDAVRPAVRSRRDRCAWLRRSGMAGPGRTGAARLGTRQSRLIRDRTMPGSSACAPNDGRRVRNLRAHRRLDDLVGIAAPARRA